MDVAPGSNYCERFVILERIGTGGTATVFKAYDSHTKQFVALKIFIVDGRDPVVVNTIWDRECTALGRMEHAAIVRLIDAGREHSSERRYIALEWIEGVTLEAHLERHGALNWTDFYLHFGRAIAHALIHAAERNVAHRDLSTENVMVTVSGDVRIIDFGQARVSETSLGRTVEGWRTAPYCPPEVDGGTHTNTRDAYSFAAIAVRALSGARLKDYEDLYDGLARAHLEPTVRRALSSALDRDPRLRYPTMIEFVAALEPAHSTDVASPAKELTISFRLAPSVIGGLAPPEDDEPRSATDMVLEELNEGVAVAATPTSDAEVTTTRISIETPSFRFIADVDTVRGDHLVVISAIRKRYRLDSLYHEAKWIPRARFVSALPDRQGQREQYARDLRSFYEGLEEFQSVGASAPRNRTDEAVNAWTRLLDAQRYLARTTVLPLRYSRLEQNGRRLFATVENPEDASPEEVRTISVNGRWVFRGTVESIRAATCVLVSNRPRFDLDSLPSRGQLDIDWQQSKIALDRQARAVERFKARSLPNLRLGRLITGEETAPPEPAFAVLRKFFDSTLDPPKKEIVSRFLAGAELLVAHGPPGTGKTKLIVELVKQAVDHAPDCRILLVSQTHVALDNALERLIDTSADISCVRIGSGAIEADPRVAQYTVAQRSVQLRAHVEKSSREFLSKRAIALGIEKERVELGLRVLDVVGVLARLQAVTRQVSDIEVELKDTSDQVARTKGSRATSERSTATLKLQSLEQQLDEVTAQKQLTEAELAASVQRLREMGETGAQLAAAPEAELRDRANMLISDETHRGFGELLKLAEEWRIRFGQSDEFTAAIIGSSTIVAGTCVGFCREDAASRATFDICIVDEAGKATSTELLVPLTQSRRAVLVGDHHQLPAVFDFELRNRPMMDRFELTRDQLERQLFERLSTELAPGALAALDLQYRMRSPIGDLVSTCFYDGKLRTDPSVNDRRVFDLSLAGLARPVTFLDPYVGRFADRYEERVGTSYLSHPEVDCIVALLRRITFVLQGARELSLWPSVAVISGYGPQASMIRREIKRHPELDRLAVECATVSAFQGREVDICVYSVTRRNKELRIGMLTDWRHLNVALSRARDFLVIVGETEFCRSAPSPNPFARILEFIEASPLCSQTEWADD